jgi:hypothetical protein
MHVVIIVIRINDKGPIRRWDQCMYTIINHNGVYTN